MINNSELVEATATTINSVRHTNSYGKRNYQFDINIKPIKDFQRLQPNNLTEVLEH